MLPQVIKSLPLTAFVSGFGASTSRQSALKLYRDSVVQAKRCYARGTGGGLGSAFRVKQGVGLGVGQKTGTLRERLLGPTTGKPFIYGTYGLAGASAVGIGALCYYGLGLSNEIGALERAAFWPQYVRDRIQMTYTYLGAGLGFTAAAAIGAARTPAILNLMSRNSLLALFGSMAAIIGSGAIARGIPYQPGMPGMKHVAWMAHCAILGAVLAPMCYLGGPLLIRAAWYTAGVVGGLSAVAACAPSDKFLTMGGPLAMGLGLVFVSSIGTWFLPPTSALGAGLFSIAVYGGLVLFGMFLLYDTQRVVKLAEVHPQWAAQPFDPINAQMSIYLDIINIFIRIAMIMGMGGSRRK